MNRTFSKPTRSLRILIVDNRHARGLEIERTLNLLGYYRIAPLRQMGELQSVVKHALNCIDLLLVHHDVSRDPDLDLQTYCRSSPMIRHFIIYGDSQTSITAMPLWLPRVNVTIANLPDVDLLARVMRVMELLAGTKRQRSPY
ncbi:hypothetical protein GCM10009091_03110 [Pseudomonas brenneri]|uniref:Uncharacterized protein n=1 Tax=Pseudomonas brenneri TaxID=129817 RepID=A0A5B2V3Y0_9PSED|nr:hypothetical protein [Pseudomonas brenneri]KAA6177468.1 hypothetical protein F3K50_06710 [Pseudomonas marginalis]KAA2233664.1 hypothetical protein F1720_01140 [Pseudomonas brenneri]TWR82102.1 hypothetical protein FJD34_01565 [Pseudomonas brenneri]WJM88926.1 hypothetical protein QDY63_16160 [Pseudomonas brenneri]SDU93433.1 hypothetical protein SAMN04490181_1781 [Pseudomonas brenneri]